MPLTALQIEMQSLIEAKDFGALKRMISQMEYVDLVDLLRNLEGEDLAVVFCLLTSDSAADVFADLEFEDQESLVKTLSSEKITAIVTEMAPDDRTALLEELPDQLAMRLLSSLKGDEQKIARDLLAWPEDSIGRQMTPEYIAVQADWTIQQVLEHLREVGPEKETLNVIYVVDENGKLLDELTLAQLVLRDPTALAARDLMDHQVTSLQVTNDRESAIEPFKVTDAVALPVVTSGGVLVGIVTADDVLDVAEEEDTEDFQLVTGMGPLEHSYFGTDFWGMIRKRLPWLVMLLLAQTLTTAALTGFASLPLFIVLVVFVPLINSPAGNTGSQMAGLMIRGLAVQELDTHDWARVLRRELVRGLTLGAVLGVMGYGVALVFGRVMLKDTAGAAPEQIALAVSISLVVVVTIGNIIGSMLPLMFKKIGVDPAVTSGPFIASLMDVSAIVIYFSIAISLLHAVG